VNDNKELEKEADVMGAEALQNENKKSPQIQLMSSDSSTQLSYKLYVNTINDIPIQRAWTKNPKDNVYSWDKIENGLNWFYEGGKMWYDIVVDKVVDENHLEWYKYFKGEKKSYKEWCRIFDGTKSLKTHAATNASVHTSGNYKARNAVIATLTKHNLLDACLEDGWDINKYRDKEQVLKYFKETYDIKCGFMDNEPVDCFQNYFEQSLPIIKGFKQLGTGEAKLVGIRINRGDSEETLVSMGLLEIIKKMPNGKTTPLTQKVKFLGVVSTAKGDPGENIYAHKATVIWILEIGPNHHGFDFRELIQEGYVSEKEITFPPGVCVEIESVTTHNTDEFNQLRPARCENAKYTIHGKIF
jgi:hypothetical protein